MNRAACRIAVEVNLDGVPGWGYEAEDFRTLVERALLESVPHYMPVVTVECERFSREP